MQTLRVFIVPILTYWYLQRPCFFNGKMSFCRTKFRFAEIFSIQKESCPSGEEMKNSQLIFLMAEFKNLTGRPKKEGERRSKKIDARFTQTEYELVLAMEKSLGITKTELVRLRVLNGSRRMLMNTKELISQMDALGAEMGRIGNNINQFAKHANIMRMSGDVPVYVLEKFNSLFGQYLDVQQRLETVFRKVIRLAGK
ncbi:plasmid mobilization protein [Mucilaginibacter terrae]|uniref:Plasmid mobilization relaxosome protein MobC n=1 Tax=Mucilaginibacter terrae TaxID=1955052 RepID=A0ABU3GNA5_9SPHI|nr:plasmid mobilization relaxosome protein MobC [Mucilaginibacter terrae]MDT3401267.1 hypothetical protein [Mucilaginibacter terrae]